jgi:tRNA threonylcarbamoyladenosine biosynthesis protein TsaE
VTIRVITNSSKQTENFGKLLGNKLQEGDVIALYGELGTGKTTLTRGIAKGLGVKNLDFVISPSFVLIREYTGRLPLYHIDLYRIRQPLEAEAMGIEEYISSGGVCVIEWAERVKEILPKQRIDIILDYKDEGIEKSHYNKRSLKINMLGKRYRGIVKSLKKPQH